MARLTVATAMLLSLALVQIHCTSSTTLHPTPENIPDATDPSLVIDLSNPEDWEEKPIFPDTTGFETALYGREDGEEHEILIWVQDLAYDGKGTLFILDADPRSARTSNIRIVHMVGKDGKYLGSLGRQGEGPDEFMYPRRLLVTEQGNALFVLGAERHIDVYRRNDSGSFSYSERVSMPTGVSEACAMRDHLYYLRYDGDQLGVIHKYTLDGQYITGFGDAYKSSNSFVVADRSDSGSLVCNERQGVIAFVPDNTPVMYGFDMNGVLLWRIKVEGIKSNIEVREEIGPRGGRSISFMPTRAKRGVGDLWPRLANRDEYIYLNIAMPSGNDKFHAPTIRVDPQTGAWEHIGDGIIPTIAEKDLLVSMPSPFEEVIQVRIRTRSE